MQKSFGRIGDISAVANIDRDEEDMKEEYDSHYTDEDLAIMDSVSSARELEELQRAQRMQKELEESLLRGQEMSFGGEYSPMPSEEERIRRSQEREKEAMAELEKALAETRLKAQQATALPEDEEQAPAEAPSRTGSVNVNTAAKHLLTYVSGLGPLLAQNIVDYRAKHGAFRNRRQLLDVPRMGPKAFEQSAGFLRIDGGDNPLDNSAVHPESYPIVEQMAKDQKCNVTDLLLHAERRKMIDLQRYVTCNIGLPTLEDIMKELEKPGRDPRQKLEEFSFSNEVKVLDDVQEGMVLPGIVTNITNFGAFVDIGVHTQGLVHVSEMADRFVKDPNTIVSLHQHVTVRVKEVDLKRGRLSLSMKKL